MSEIKMHTRHQWMRENGKRISRGGWERLNRAYEVHIHPGKARIVGFEMNEDGTYRVNEKGQRIPKLGPCFTLTLLRESVKCNRKVSMVDRYDKDRSKRQKYLGEPAGITR